ncbi:MAG: hypothetical protein COB02_08735 [Candidatus Cloacimonadota bacterium]|nr:MAG: hypothetical protein COB02_08735 [Candidatus Cloacimonadota bacterium]
MNEVFALATDTSWGLACNANDKELVQKIYKLKGRNFKKPLILFTFSLAEAKKLIEIPSSLENWLNNFWPGDLTLVAKAKSNKYFYCHQDTSFLGVRIPNHETALNFLIKINQPLAVTSYNLSNNKNIQKKEEICSTFKNFSPTIIGEISKVTSESAILQLKETQLKILRATSTQINNLSKTLPNNFSLLR